MKALFCCRCGSIQSPPNDKSWRSCLCGKAEVRWLDPMAGRMEVKTDNLNKARVIGFHNTMLESAIEFNHLMNKDWNELHQGVIENSHGYIFHQDMRACWAAIVSQGETGDIVWTKNE